jgi:hypothetical protein
MVPIMFKLSVIKVPSGAFSLVGSGPASAFYVGSCGEELPIEQIERQLMLPTKYRTIKSRTFTTETDAVNYLERYL